MWWSIFYGDGTVVSGTTQAEWLAAPADGVQVVAEWRIPASHERRWHLDDGPWWDC